ncbi:MAG: hypothetical protein EBX50_20605, partial [Chitinophagia bacterium]|nr:hypothetical protein [Chitinophagia bacterium]
CWYKNEFMKYLHLSNLDEFIRQPLAVVMYSLPNGIGCWECELNKIRLANSQSMVNTAINELADPKNTAFLNAYYPEELVGLFIIEWKNKIEIDMLKYEGITELPCVIRYEYGVAVERHKGLADGSTLFNLMFRHDLDEI